MISKYPPIEGGVSSRIYWLAKALGERGHDVHIVTNASEVEEEYRQKLENNDPQYAPENVYIHTTNSDNNPWHIPFSKAYTERIANLAIEVIEKHDIRIIDSSYILPYCISGFIAKNITGRLQILRHAGSDMGKLFASSSYNTLFKAIFQRADKIITIPPLKEMFLSLGIPGSKISFDEKVSVNTKAFNPEVAPFPLFEHIKKRLPEYPIITYIGKINYYWKTKGLYELLEAVSKIKNDYILLFVANGKGFEEFQRIVKEKKLSDRSIFLDFVPPWKIPSIIKLSTCVVILEREFPIQYHIPILPREVMAIGKCLVLSQELFNKQCYGNLNDGENAFIIDPKNIERFRNILKYIISNPSAIEEMGRNAYQASKKIEHFNEYIDQTIITYSSFLK